MTPEEKLERLRLMVGDGESDEVLIAYLDLAERLILGRCYPYATEASELVMPPKYEYLQLEIAALKVNKRGAEGAISYSESGSVMVMYQDPDVPNSMLDVVVPYVGRLS